MLPTRQAAPDALCRTKRGDLFLAEKNLAAIGFEHAGYQIDQRRLARAIGTDQGMAFPARKLDRDILCRDQRAEALVQTAGGQRNTAHAERRAAGSRRAKPPRMPLGRNTTTTIKSIPIQKYQYCGLRPEN